MKHLITHASATLLLLSSSHAAQVIDWMDISAAPTSGESHFLAGHNNNVTVSWTLPTNYTRGGGTLGNHDTVDFKWDTFELFAGTSGSNFPDTPYTVSFDFGLNPVMAGSGSYLFIATRALNGDYTTNPTPENPVSSTISITNVMDSMGANITNTLDTTFYGDQQTTGQSSTAFDDDTLTFSAIGGTGNSGSGILRINTTNISSFDLVVDANSSTDGYGFNIGYGTTEVASVPEPSSTLLLGLGGLSVLLRRRR